MATQSFKVADSDMHVLEPADLWLNYIDPQYIVFSTDYPHGDSKYPRATEQFLRLPMPEATSRKILWDNWARLYGF